ncbi:RNA methyltransferase related protein [Methanosarcina barkeri 227]|uniref:RNA methyltransferase related protein n=4 Tax=Methanosarcina TaxID=2207 RepID=A0A0E3QRH7_METBA|nr:50S ribosomal protein L11 methyltransferase [Methanosarcina barkeri]AKB53100.1 RNA methyltransferase related protein [Methanosarcina barkeri MS]AKB58794.1 RNA methyltransferase related protein [Methanosarcina barkeri 227]AKJ39603.1 SAM-dependent methyltransferase [Methanosarcina barkeri CM1]
MRCRCGDTCIRPISEALKDIELFYKPCKDCKTEKIKKFSPLAEQINLDEIDNDFGSCKCGKRHLDIVMSHVLKIMINEGIKDKKANLRNSCIPLVTPGYLTDSVPYLPKGSLVILSDKVDKKCAERIITEVREVRGVLKGDIRKTVGIKDSDSNPHVYELLAGCDLRCDIVQTPYGALGIYKYQREIHIEFPQVKSPKIEILEKALKDYDKPTVLDCTCGPGTLGIACLKANAQKVVFNDIWSPAIEITLINLEANGFPVKFSGSEKGLIASGDKFEVYNMDVRELTNYLDEKFDICIIDTFPGVDTIEFVEAGEKLGKKVVVV